MSRTRFWSRLGLYGALIAAWGAMMGSLYLSEVSGFTPCSLCWYQRILMYPLAGLLALGILRRDHHLPHLVLPFSLLGQGVAVYHFLLQKTTLFGAPAACGLGITCTTVWINWFGFVTIPLMAMIGFMVITMGMLMVIAAEDAVPDRTRPYRWPRWPVPIAIALVIGLYIAGAVQAGRMQISLPDVNVPGLNGFSIGGMASQPAEPTATPTNVERGQSLYAQACASCHGAQGEGVEGLGSPVAESPYVAAMSDNDLRALIEEGRAADAPDNRAGMAMPPLGGQSHLSAEQIGDLILLLRGWQ